MSVTGSDNKHARLSPSDSKRWTQCTAAIAYQEANAHRVLHDDGSDYSREGTEAHEWAAKLLRGQITDLHIPPDFRDPVVAYVNHCKSLLPKGTGYMVEVSVPLYYQRDQKGTCDFAIVTDDLIDIEDYKHGAGVLVTPQDNTQIAIYGYSLVKLLEDIHHFHKGTKVRLGIFQPRHREGAGQEPWELTLGELADFCRDIEAQAVIAHAGADQVRDALPCGERDISPEEILEAAPGLAFHPEEGDGGSCRWCKCKAFCPIRLSGFEMESHGLDASALLEMMPDLTKEETKLPVEERIKVRTDSVNTNMSDDFLVAVLRNRKAFESFLDDVTTYLEGRALEGNPAKGTKLVLGRQGNRAWRNEQEADTFLLGQKLKAEERYQPRKIISPTDAEKILHLEGRGLTRFNELIVRSEAKKVITTSDDKRPAVDADITLMPDLTETHNEFEV